MTASRPDVRLGAAVLAAKLTAVGVRRAGRGGTAAPGLVADRIDPHMMTKLATRLERGALLVAGTNGKTTVSRMLSDILSADGARVVHNRSGSNLVRGVAATFAQHASFTGDPHGDVAVIEADEAAMPELLRRIQPRAVLLNNLFRDQLDRYGELHTIARKWRAALATLPADAVVIANVDDPLLAETVTGITARVLAFGLDDPNPAIQLAELPHAADTIGCRTCGARLTYDALYVGHLGAWHCPNCHTSRPALGVSGRAVRLDGVESVAIDLLVRPENAGERTLTIEAGVPGLYNAYNVLAAAAAATALAVPDATIIGALAGFRAAFGRIERATLDNRHLTLALIKNPTGCNEVLRMLTGSGEATLQRNGGAEAPPHTPTAAQRPPHRSDSRSAASSAPMLIAINDLDADGRDVSWLWDVDFEVLATGDAPLFTAGIRGADMANRLKYAGVPIERITHLPGALPAALDRFVAELPSGSFGYILPTYTAMLAIRQSLADRGAVEAFWKQ